MADDAGVERWFWIVLAVMAFTVYSLILLHLGGWLYVEQARAEAAKIVTARRIEPIPQPAQLIKCDKHGREEFLRTCRARARTTEVR